MVRTTTTRIIAIGYGGGEGWNWICLSCGHPYCSCCGTSHRDPLIKRNVAVNKKGLVMGRRGCEICGSTKVALKDADVGDFLKDLHVDWITKQTKPSESKICGKCGRFQPCKTGDPRGGKCQDPEGPVYNRFIDDLPFNEFCWIPILDEPETIMKKLLEIDDETGRIHAYIETYTGVINGHRYERYRDWDVDWCERDSCYYAHESGDCTLPLEGPNTGYTRIPLGVNFDLNEVATDGEDTYWCALCKDELPRGSPCEHGDPDGEENLVETK